MPGAVGSVLVCGLPALLVPGAPARTQEAAELQRYEVAGARGGAAAVHQGTGQCARLDLRCGRDQRRFSARQGACCGWRLGSGRLWVGFGLAAWCGRLRWLLGDSSSSS